MISADVEPADADTTWVVGEGLSRSSSCPTKGTTSLREFPPPQIRVWGCKAGSHQVSLKIRGATNSLADITITVRRVNRTPTVMIETGPQTVDGGGASVSLDATASDPDGDPLTYSWSGSGSFEDENSLDTKWTAPAAQSTDRTYKLTVTVSDGSLSTNASVSITVRRVNRTPTVMIETGPQTVDGGASVSLDATASDPDGDSLTYSWSGSGSFANSNSLDTTWTAPAAQSSDRTYTLRVRVSDGSLSATDSVSIRVRRANRRPTVMIDTAAQTVDGGASVSLDATASDPDGDSLTYSWSGSGSFANSNSLDTTWTAPAAQSSDRTYTLRVRVSDGSLSATDSVSIRVRRANRTPTVTIETAAQTVDGGSSVSLDATASDPDGDSLTYSWSGSGSFEDENSLDTTWTAPAAQSSDRTYTLRVTVSDGSLSTNASVSITVRRVNRTPTIDPGPSSVSYAENGTGPVATYTASDPDDDTISWSLPNTTFETDGSDFSINRTGQLSFDSSPNHESPHDSNGDNVYKVTVRASDGTLTDDRDVTITVTNEKPTIDSGLHSPSYAEGGMGAVSTYRASDPGDGDITWSLPDTRFETDSSDFTISGGVLRFRSSPDHESPHDSNGDNVYKVTVRASDGTLTDDRDVTITVTNVNERPEEATPIGDQTLTVGANRGFLLSNNFSDPDGDTLRYTTSSSATGVATASVRGGTLTITAVAAGTATVRVTAHDRVSGGLSISQSFTVTVPNRPPVVRTEILNQTLTVGANRGISLSDKFRDPDGDTLRYTANSSAPGVATASVSGSDLTITAVRVGTATVTVTAHDRASGGLSVYQDFTVTVERSAPDKVAGLKGTPGSVRGEIALDWDPADGADSYEVAEWRRRLPLIPILYHWVVLDDSEVTIDSNNTSALVHGLEGGNTYRHRVRGVGGVGSDRVEGEWSDHVDTPLTLPDKVAGLTGSPGPNHGEISLTWNAADGATGYQVRQKKPRRFLPDTWIELPGEGFGVAVVGATAVVSNLDPDKEYVYQVRGTNVHGEGGWSDSSEEIAVRDERPDIPTGLMLVQIRGGRGLTTGWNAATGADDYEIEVSFAGSNTLTVVRELTVGFIGMTPRAAYSFRVRSRKPYGGGHLTSGWSGTVTVSAPEPTNSGHQEDHTAAYKVGTIASAPNLPAGVPNPAAVISAAIDPAAAAWTASSTAIVGKNLKICKSSDSACSSSNHDGGIVTVKTVTSTTMDAGPPPR